MFSHLQRELKWAGGHGWPLVDERVAAEALADFYLGRIQGKQEKQPERFAARFMTIFTTVIKSLRVRAAERAGGAFVCFKMLWWIWDLLRGKWKFNTALGSYLIIPYVSKIHVEERHAISEH